MKCYILFLTILPYTDSLLHGASTSQHTGEHKQRHQTMRNLESVERFWDNAALYHSIPENNLAEKNIVLKTLEFLLASDPKILSTTTKAYSALTYLTCLAIKAAQGSREWDLFTKIAHRDTNNRQRLEAMYLGVQSHSVPVVETLLLAGTNINATPDILKAALEKYNSLPPTQLEQRSCLEKIINLLRHYKSAGTIAQLSHQSSSSRSSTSSASLTSSSSDSHQRPSTTPTPDA